MLDSVLGNTNLEEVDDGIYSCLEPGSRHGDYDQKVAVYDLVVGNALYNRLIWGNWPSAYDRFCRDALSSARGGCFLDAGCGSLVFTADAYASAHNKLIVLLDRSLGMLRKGKARIEKRCGKVPDSMVFLQGDIFSLPFRNGVFDAIASFGVLHLFEEKITLLAELERVGKAPRNVFFSSLVGNNAIGKRYLSFLQKAGEVSGCHSSESLGCLLSTLPSRYALTTIGNMAYGNSA